MAALGLTQEMFTKRPLCDRPGGRGWGFSRNKVTHQPHPRGGHVQALQPGSDRTVAGQCGRSRAGSQGWPAPPNEKRGKRRRTCLRLSAQPTSGTWAGTLCLCHLARALPTSRLGLQSTCAQQRAFFPLEGRSEPQWLCCGMKPTFSCVAFPLWAGTAL